jgi:hypothetical protein
LDLREDQTSRIFLPVNLAALNHHPALKQLRIDKGPNPLVESLRGTTRLLTDSTYLDCIPDKDPFEKLDLIPHSDLLVFSGSLI